MSCQRCGKPGHSTAFCPSRGFTKLWKGEHACQVKLKTPDGGLFELEGVLTEEQYKRLGALVSGFLLDKLKEPHEHRAVD